MASLDPGSGVSGPASGSPPAESTAARTSTIIRAPPFRERASLARALLGPARFSPARGTWAARPDGCEPVLHSLELLCQDGARGPRFAQVPRFADLLQTPRGRGGGGRQEVRHRSLEGVRRRAKLRCVPLLHGSFDLEHELP